MPPPTKSIPFEKSLAALFPEVAAQWHPTKNPGVSPGNVVAMTMGRFWWKCSQGPDHEWSALLVSRTRKGSGCPFCFGIRVSVTNSLSSLRPDLAEQWHPTRNGRSTPSRVTASGELMVWWRCAVAEDHEWQASLYSRTKLGTKCPFCAGRRASVTNSIAAQRPDLVAEWHPTKNGSLTPDAVAAGSSKKVWWACRKEPSHEWEARAGRRARGGGCPFCGGDRVSVSNSLASLRPDLAAQFHPTKNGLLRPDEVVAGSGKRFWWQCPNNLEHEWEATADKRFRSGRGCPFCSNRRVSAGNSLAALRPDLVAEWHPEKNGGRTPADVTAGSHAKLWWKCPIGPDHEWEAPAEARVRAGSGCPFCAGNRLAIGQSLAALAPAVAAEWHPTKNGHVTPDQVSVGTTKKYWWQCPQDPAHEWEQPVGYRVRGSSCPLCGKVRRQIPPLGRSLISRYPDVVAKFWHPSRNGSLRPDHLFAASERSVWWRCAEGSDHEWEQRIAGLTSDGRACPFCAGMRVSVTNSLAARFPEIAKEWHPTKNEGLTPGTVVAGSGTRVWWRCSRQADHEWQAPVGQRSGSGSGCPRCNSGWTLASVRTFVSALLKHMNAFTSAELFVLFQQSGLLDVQGRSRSFIRALTTGRFPVAELETFAKGEPSLVDRFVIDASLTLVTEKSIEDLVDEPTGREPDRTLAASALPVVSTAEALAGLGLGSDLMVSADDEAVAFLVASATAKVWKHAFLDERSAVAQAEAFEGDEYAERVRQSFLDEYREARNLDIPGGYDFRIDGRLTEPNLMQRVIAVRVRDRHRVGNWSGTGAGKTLSAILASRVIGASLTIVCCPNSVVDGWRRDILAAYPDSIVATKTFEPDWAALTDDPLPSRPRYLVLNYEAFQQPDSASRVARLLDSDPVDFVVIDEVHYTKQRTLENMSLRRGNVVAMLARAAEMRPDLYVLGMAATPVINNLQEGKSLIEMVSGVVHDDLDTRTTIANCMSLHQRLVRLGIRWMPEYNIVEDEVRVPVDCSEFLDEIRALGSSGSPLKLEQILTKARLPEIRRQVRRKTLIYTHYIAGIDRMLRDALVDDGWTVGFYTGEDKDGLEQFIDGDLDVLIGSSAIGTGVDRLQHVCNRLIINALPWTAAGYEQLKGRVYRQGQKESTVTIVLPLTFADVGGERWSWCDSRMERLRFKKSIADAAVDGVVPEGHLRSEAQAYQDAMSWLARLETGVIEEVVRRPLVVPLPDTDPTDVQRRQRRYGDFSRLNHSWNQSKSETTHLRLQKNPEEWQQYHTLYREHRKAWSVVPYEEMIRWCEARTGYVIGDFGCGEALLAAAVNDRHTVHRFDHVALNDDVVACDMAHVPLDDDSLDVAVFSLSLMGSNFTDYLREAQRTLKLDGHLHIYEATSRFTDLDGFLAGLRGLGFQIVGTEAAGSFTHIWGLKSGRLPKDGLNLNF